MAKCLNPRKYRWPVRIEQLKESESNVDSGGHVDQSEEKNWKTFCEGYAEIIATGGREYVNRVKVNANVDYMMTMPATAVTEQIQPKMRLVRITDDLTINLMAVYPVGADEREMQLQGKRVVE